MLAAQTCATDTTGFPRDPGNWSLLGQGFWERDNHPGHVFKTLKSTRIPACTHGLPEQICLWREGAGCGHACLSCDGKNMPPVLPPLLPTPTLLPLALQDILKGSLGLN